MERIHARPQPFPVRNAPPGVHEAQGRRLGGAATRRAADQGPLDWMVPFIPPFLRVNRETRHAMWSGLARALQPQSIQNGLQTATGFLRTRWTSVLRIGVVGGLWIAGLVWIQHNIHEFAATYVILSGLVVLAVHLFSGDDKDKPQDGLSAYSVFNKGGQRMMGSLSAEQFENEIRHRQPGARDEDNHIDAREQQEPQDASDEDDPDLMMALQLSLQEKKREERRARRTRRR